MDGARSTSWKNFIKTIVYYFKWIHLDQTFFDFHARVKKCHFCNFLERLIWHPCMKIRKSYSQSGKCRIQEWEIEIEIKWRVAWKFVNSTYFTHASKAFFPFFLWFEACMEFRFFYHHGGFFCFTSFRIWKMIFPDYS